MTNLEAILSRHSVRQYKDDPIPEDIAAKLQQEIDDINAEGNMKFQMVLNDSEAFDSKLAHYGSFSNVKNYIGIIAKKAKNLDEKVGYYVARLVIFAQTLGLNTCICAMSFSRKASKVVVEKEDKYLLGIALGYGVTQGVQHKCKPLESLCAVEEGEMPEWFKNGMKAAMAAPTAINQQKYKITLKSDGTCKIEAKFGPCSKIDLGIVKYHFEVGAEPQKVVWAEKE